MGFWHNDEKEKWKEFISLISQETGLNSLMIEKDTLQSYLLDAIFKQESGLVFKGGTSLSKGYGIINRFSEDIDLALNEKATNSMKNSLYDTIYKCASDLGLKLLNEDSIKKRGGFVRYNFEYESLFDENRQSLIIETSFMQRSYPTNMINVSSIVSKFCKDNGVSVPVGFASADITINVQSLERTFIDKVFAICDYYLGKDTAKHSRHLYDIAKLAEHLDFDRDYSKLISEVKEDRSNPKFHNYSAQNNSDITELLKEIISEEAYKSDYNNVTLNLLYSPIPYDEAIKKGIQVVINKGIFNKKG